MFSCEFYDIFKNTFFIEHLWTTAFVTPTNEEAKTLIILHAKNSNGSSEPSVFSPDTDPLIFESTKFVTGKKDVERKIDSSQVYSSIWELQQK